MLFIEETYVLLHSVFIPPCLCKSKSEKSGRIPSGDYEYVDINVNGTRYIIEIFLATEFELATSLVELIPNIFVGKIEELKQWDIMSIALSVALAHAADPITSLMWCLCWIVNQLYLCKSHVLCIKFCCFAVLYGSTVEVLTQALLL
ncbi:hypothetical protein LguiB_011650 [Lonicera macranthoides]